MSISLRIIYVVIILAFFQNNSFSISQYESKDIRLILKKFRAEKSLDTIKAYNLIQQANKFALQLNDTLLIAECLIEKAEYLGFLDSTNQAMLTFSKSIQFYNNTNHKSKLAEAYYRYGTFLKNKNKYGLSLNQFSMAEKIFRASKQNKKIIECLIQLGSIHIIQGDWSLAMKNFVEALDFAQQIKDQHLIAESWHQIGIVHWKEGNNKKALEAYNQSLAIRLKNSDSLGIASTYSNIGVINKIEKKYSIALSYYRKSLGIRQRYNDKIGVAHVLFNIGSVQQELAHYDESLMYYEKSLSIKNQLNDNYAKLGCYLNMGDLFVLTKNYIKAEEIFLVGLNLSKKIGTNDYTKSFLRELSVLFKILSNFEKAYEYHVEYMTIKDTLLSREKNQELIELQTKYDIAEKERNIEKLEEENKLGNEKQARANTLRNSLIFIVLLALILIGFIFNRVKFLQRTNLKLNQQKVEIEKREKEKELLLREIHHRVKNNLQLTSSLLNLQSRQIKDVEASNSLKEARDRIKAISLIHQKLYTRDQFSSVDLKIYIPELCSSLLETSGASHNKIKFNFNLVSTIFSLDDAISTGLILNEIITNSIKHAFKEKAFGNIKLSSVFKDKDLILIVADDGIGINKNKKVEEGFGLQLIRSLATKLKATIEFEYNNGTTITLTIPINTVI